MSYDSATVMAYDALLQSTQSASKKRKSPESPSYPRNNLAKRQRTAPSNEVSRDRSHQLPAELWHRILTYLPPHCLGKLLRVSKKFQGYLEPSISAKPVDHGSREAHDAGATLYGIEPFVPGHDSRPQLSLNFEGGNIESSAALAAASGPCGQLGVVEPLAANDIWKASRCLYWPALPSPLESKTELEMWRLIANRGCQFCNCEERSAVPKTTWHTGPGTSGAAPIFPFSSRACGACLESLCVKELDIILAGKTPSFLLPGIPVASVAPYRKVVPPSALKAGRVPAGTPIVKMYWKSHVTQIEANFQRVKLLGTGALEEWLKGLQLRQSSMLKDMDRLESWAVEDGFTTMKRQVAATLKQPPSAVSASAAKSRRDPKDVLDAEWDEVQAPVRTRLARYADDYIRHKWKHCKKLRSKSSAFFATGLLMYAQNRFYKDVASEAVLDEPVEGPWAQKLTLENMKWLFDLKIKPRIWKKQEELFLCNGCSTTQLYTLDGVIQHYAAKHTASLSHGNVVVFWRSEWPRPPPFRPNPGGPTVNVTEPGDSVQIKPEPDDQVDAAHSTRLLLTLPPQLNRMQEDQMLHILPEKFRAMNKFKGPNAIRATAIVRCVSQELEARFGELATFATFQSLFLQCKMSLPLKKLRRLECAACSGSAPVGATAPQGSIPKFKSSSHLKGSGGKPQLYSLETLLLHFRKKHVKEVQLNLDWQTQMIRLPDLDSIRQMLPSWFGKNANIDAVLQDAYPGVVPEGGRPQPRKTFNLRGRISRDVHTLADQGSDEDSEASVGQPRQATNPKLRPRSDSQNTAYRSAPRHPTVADFKGPPVLRPASEVYGAPLSKKQCRARERQDLDSSSYRASNVSQNVPADSSRGTREYHAAPRAVQEVVPPPSHSYGNDRDTGLAHGSFTRGTAGSAAAEVIAHVPDHAHEHREQIRYPERAYSWTADPGPRAPQPYAPPDPFHQQMPLYHQPKPRYPLHSARTEAPFYDSLGPPVCIAEAPSQQYTPMYPQDGYCPPLEEFEIVEVRDPVHGTYHVRRPVRRDVYYIDEHPAPGGDDSYGYPYHGEQRYSYGESSR
ncbi:uncharacterized protein F5Z01DRAFT_675007 [Emericellopsis atlantica]|uniref:F-box domain-containing protein n=1 Tax=Emericellopsis atlantica TaxID=2614577 RepID=A0A9P7ZK52_9HYPO|nr:uncharacterized protein F5Z01DRAFT_675007 [Emericellopsis atlantica]KAG9253599.1 hypothetical protein F5Z01DRAFT_675007 [Emericellopsis atlantica]